ncbi:MAG: hypothetical protein NZ704_00210, partial [Geminicoccaceae bacterium]|nr:hypothetical protein [Geminicoccaceae bacterium]
ATVEDDPGVAERTPDRRDRSVADDGGDDLVPIETVRRIGAQLAADPEAGDGRALPAGASAPTG